MTRLTISNILHYSVSGRNILRLCSNTVQVLFSALSQSITLGNQREEEKKVAAHKLYTSDLCALGQSFVINSYILVTVLCPWFTFCGFMFHFQLFFFFFLFTSFFLFYVLVREFWACWFIFIRFLGFLGQSCKNAYQWKQSSLLVHAFWSLWVTWICVIGCLFGRLSCTAKALTLDIICRLFNQICSCQPCL